MTESPENRAITGPINAEDIAKLMAFDFSKIDIDAGLDSMTPMERRQCYEACAALAEKCLAAIARAGDI